MNYGLGTDPLDSIQGYLTNGFNSGWTGTGIISTAVANANSITNQRFAIGYIDGANPPYPAAPSSGTIEILPTLAGDAQLVGTASFHDFQDVLSNFGKATQSWGQGNFDYQSSVDFYDFQAVLSNFGQGLAGLTDPVDPPAPQVTLSIVASGGEYTVYAKTSTGDNAGLANFDVDVQGDGGVVLGASHNLAPIGEVGSYSYGYNIAGFASLNSNGTDGDGIHAAQNTAYYTAQTYASVIQGIGQTSGSIGTVAWTQTSLGVAIARGTFTGTGTLTVNVDSDGFVEVLDIDGDGSTPSAGVSIAQVTGDTISV